jgi:hypothetical protein
MLVTPKEDGSQGARRKFPADDPLCVKALALRKRYLRLRRGAAAWAKKVEAASRTDGKGALQLKFDPARIPMSPLIDDVEFPNAYYAYFPGSSKPGYIQVNKGFVMKEDGDEGAASFGVSHELGHGVQHALGVNSEHCHRGHEAQADRWGAGILREAGLAGDKSPRQVAIFFEEDRIASDAATKREEKGCRAHPSGRTRFVNAVLAEELFGKDGVGGSAIGKTLMALDRDKVLGAADVIFDGDRAAERASDPAAVTGVARARTDFGKDGTLRKSDFEPGGKLVIRDDLILDLKKSEVKAPAVEKDLSGVLLGQLYRLGNVSDWQNPFLHSVIAKGVRENAKGLKGALLAGLKAMSPTDIAKKNTLRLVIALQDSLGAGPQFARYFRLKTGRSRRA